MYGDLTFDGKLRKIHLLQEADLDSCGRVKIKQNAFSTLKQKIKRLKARITISKFNLRIYLDTYNKQRTHEERP